jgi:hypothetical protein
MYSSQIKIVGLKSTEIFLCNHIAQIYHKNMSLTYLEMLQMHFNLLFFPVCIFIIKHPKIKKSLRVSGVPLWIFRRHTSPVNHRTNMTWKIYVPVRYIYTIPSNPVRLLSCTAKIKIKTKLMHHIIQSHFLWTVTQDMAIALSTKQKQ